MGSIPSGLCEVQLTDDDSGESEGGRHPQRQAKPGHHSVYTHSRLKKWRKPHRVLKLLPKFGSRSPEVSEEEVEGSRKSRRKWRKSRNIFRLRPKKMSATVGPTDASDPERSDEEKNRRRGDHLKQWKKPGAIIRLMRPSKKDTAAESEESPEESR